MTDRPAAPRSNTSPAGWSGPVVFGISDTGAPCMIRYDEASTILPWRSSKLIRLRTGAPAAPFSGLLGSIATTKLTGSAGGAAHREQTPAGTVPGADGGPPQEAVPHRGPVRTR